MIAKFEPVRTAEHKDGSRLAIVFSGSPLFTGGAGSGESEIRKWIIENDWLEAIVALPEQMFYNTGIGTYVWIVTNRKEKRRKGKILRSSKVHGGGKRRSPVMCCHGPRDKCSDEVERRNAAATTRSGATTRQRSDDSAVKDDRR